MGFGKLKERGVGISVGRIESEKWVGHGRKREIDRRKSPHENEEVKPKSERPVEIPIDPPSVPTPVQLKASAPVFDAGPPDHCFGQAQRYETDTAKPIDDPRLIRKANCRVP